MGPGNEWVGAAGAVEFVWVDVVGPDVQSPTSSPWAWAGQGRAGQGRLSGRAFVRLWLAVG